MKEGEKLNCLIEMKKKCKRDETFRLKLQVKKTTVHFTPSKVQFPYLYRMIFLTKSIMHVSMTSYAFKHNPLPNNISITSTNKNIHEHPLNEGTKK